MFLRDSCNCALNLALITSRQVVLAKQLFNRFSEFGQSGQGGQFYSIASRCSSTSGRPDGKGQLDWIFPTVARSLSTLVRTAAAANYECVHGSS